MYPFGMLMPGRDYSSLNYRYGFNGKENDNDVKGEGNEQNYGMRIYDSRLGRFLSVDPLTKEYPKFTPYSFASNAPIHAIDVEGLESSADLDMNDPNVHIMYQWSKENGKGGTLLNNRYYNIFSEARTRTLGMGLGILASCYFAPAAILRFAFIGATVNTSISVLSGEDAYSAVKAAVSGFYGGLVLGAAGTTSSLLGMASAGGVSGIVSEVANQTFDNVFKNEKANYSVNKMVQSGAIGAFANVFSSQLIDGVSQEVDKLVSKEIANTSTPSYRKLIRKAVISENPRMGNQARNKEVNNRIKQIQNLINQQGRQLKAGLKTIIERGIDVAEDKANANK